MEDDERHEKRIFGLTSLQIGDMQSYLAHLSLFLANESGKFYVLVENRPRLMDHVSDPTHWWQLMVTKSRLSPFANTRTKGQKKMLEQLTELQAAAAVAAAASASTTPDVEQSWKWFTLAMSRDRALLPVQKLRDALIENSKLLHQTLFCFIVFEVAWDDVRGINYLNELQTDTSLAIEAKVMRRWEFDSIAQAARSMAAWFPGTISEQYTLKEHLDARIAGGMHQDAEESLPRTSQVNPNDTTIQDNTVYGNESFHTPKYNSIDDIKTPANTEHGSIIPQDSCICDEEIVETNRYKNVLILFRFNDPDLPFKLKDIIMSELWLLTLLEAGLPSWAIFMQSYPGFSRLYRPWMCPLARALYVLISFATVAIGFYDLYKNIPLLKATASHLFGPLFDWIEAWEMVSRIQYLGTMLFLHNFQKAMKCLLVVTRTSCSFFSVFVLPLVRPFAEMFEHLLPLMTAVMELVGDFFSVIWVVLETSFTVVGDFFEILLLPIWYILSLLWSIGTSVLYPILWMAFYAPFKLVHGTFSLLAYLCIFLYNFIGALWLSTRSIFMFSRGVESTVTTYNVSIWRSLWNDLFSKVFYALRSILNGLVVFFMACNRHRLSIYNHVKEFIRRLLYGPKRALSRQNSPTRQSYAQLIASRSPTHYTLKSTKSI